MKSEKVDQIAMALMQAQSEMPAAPMNATNPFLKNKYADLGTIIKTATPVLVKHGLAVSQQVVTESDRVGVTTTLLHTSGQWIESTVSLPLGEERGKSLAQVAGSVITYLRRYSYGSILGMYTDEDTDGNHPAKTEYKPAEQKPAPKDEKPATPYHTEGGDQISSQASNPDNDQFAGVCTEDGIPYCDLKMSDLANRFNSLSKLKAKDPGAFTAENQRKLDAVNHYMKILRSRSATA